MACSYVDFEKSELGMGVFFSEVVPCIFSLRIQFKEEKVFKFVRSSNYHHVANKIIRKYTPCLVLSVEGQLQMLPDLSQTQSSLALKLLVFQKIGIKLKSS